MKKFAAGPSIILVVALVTLFASLVALLLANSLRGQLRETQGQLEETQGQLQNAQSELQKIQEAKDQPQKAGTAGAPVREPGAANKTQPRESTKSSAQEGKGQQRAMLIGMQGDAGSSLPYLLLLSLGLMVLASLCLVVTSALSLLSGGSRSGRVGGSGASTPSHTEPSDLEHTSPSEDGRWIKLVEECVEVVDELDEHMDSFDAPRREVAGHVVLRLEEILGRSGVEVISNDAAFDRARHKPDSTHAATGNDAAVRETLSPGFAVGPRVLRRARVRLE